jgi:hypothetical protein
VPTDTIDAPRRCVTNEADAILTDVVPDPIRSPRRRRSFTVVRRAVKMSEMTSPMLTEISAITDALPLWRKLVSAAIGRPLPPAVAVDAFQRVHGRGERGAFDSALLLCTDRRWHNVSAKVISGIVDSGILDDDDQDRLADALLWQQQVRYRHPLWWISTTFIEFDLASRGPVRTVRLDPNTPTTAHRSVWPPVRAWAASRVLKRHRTSAGDVLAHARSLPARDAAAVVTGAVRAVDNLDPDHARSVLNAALNWGHKAPRKAALERLLVDGEHDLVRTLTDNDPDASIRRWADKQLKDEGGQGSLFD